MEEEEAQNPPTLTKTKNITKKTSYAYRNREKCEGNQNNGKAEEIQ